jgi:hypothetical protein
MSRLGCMVVMISCLLSPAALQAAAVSVSGDSPRQNITVTIEDARVDAVLEDLRKRYGFEVLGLENATRSDAVSATMTGSLQSVIERLLRNWNHMIVRSPDNVSGIAKVMILNAKYGAGPLHRGQGSASGSGGANDKLLQALSGGANDNF